MALSSDVGHHGGVPGRRRLQLAVVARATLLAVSVLVLSALLWWRGIAWAGEFGGIAAFILALYLALARPIGRWLRLPGVASLTAGEAADRLAAVLRSQWADEERRRRVNDPYSMPVRCRLREPASARQGEPVTGASLGALADSHVPTAVFGDISEAFQTLPLRRMVIVGPAGAGKTVMATRLAIHLASSSARPPGGPLPMILRAVNWSADERFDDWIARELVLRWRWLGDKSRDRVPGSLADALARDLVIPVIDGLDEMPEHLRICAIGQVNAWGSDKPLVLTSRPDEYDNAAAAARGISRAAQVEVLPLSIEESKAYILDATAGPSSRWDVLFRALKPGTPLSAALTVPLLLWLVRCIYGDAGSDPDELADSHRFSDLAAIERHLIERLVPSVYDQSTGVSRFGCTPRQAGRWLALLAAHPGDEDSSDVQWWRLSLAARAWRPLGFAARGALLFGVAWLLAVWALGRLGGWRHGAEVRRVLSSGLLGRRLLPTAGYIQRLLLQPDARSIRTAIDAFFDLIPWHSLAALELWVIFGSACAGLLYARSSSVRPPRKFGLPDHMLLAAALRLAVLAVQVAWILWLYFELSTLVPHQQQAQFRSAWLLFFAAVFVWRADFASWLTKRLDVAGSLNPARALRLDQRALLGRVLLRVPIRAVVVWLFLGPVLALAYALYGVTSLLAKFVLGSGATASSEFASARLWLAISRRLPWQVMAFLADAHAIGVLRQAGAAYQFRHGLLQQQLSAQYPHWARRAAGLAVRRAGWLVTFLEERSFRWRWWSSAPSRRWSEPIWALRFDEAARTLEQGVGRPAEAPRRARPGMIQLFDGSGGDDRWVMCALWNKRPVLVAKPAWDALRQVATGPVDDPTAALGFPVPTLIRYPESERVVRADADRIMLRGGSWGPGRLLRDPHDETWRWEPELNVDFVPAKEWLSAGPPAPRLRLRAEATIPLARPDLTAASHTYQELARQMASSDLVQIAAGHWSAPESGLPAGQWERTARPTSPGQGSLACAIPAAGAMPAQVAEVMWSVSHGADSTTLTAAAELRIEALRNGPHDRPGAASHPDDRQRRLPLEELLGLLLAAWHAAADLIPGAVLGNVTDLPLAGPPHVDLLVSAATPADLLFRRASCQNLSGSAVKALAAALLDERLSGLRRGRLMDFIDVSPFRAATSRPRLTEMSARITAPLRISSEDRPELVREALARMITYVNFSKRQKLTTSEQEWHDALRATFSRDSDFWL